MEGITPWPRSIASEASGVKSTFSSWDNCMAKSYCKYPVIVGIVIGSLILISVIWCCVRCLCCGMSCCCGFLECLNCCASCCPKGRPRKKSKYKDMDPPPKPNPYLGYRPPAPASTFEPAPQYAQFDVSKPVNEDSLPPMPSWNDAPSRVVEDTNHNQAMELSPLNPQPYQSGPARTMTSPDDYAQNAQAPMPPDASYGSYGGPFQSQAQAPAPPLQGVGYMAPPIHQQSNDYNQQYNPPPPQRQFDQEQYMPNGGGFDNQQMYHQPEEPGYFVNHPQPPQAQNTFSPYAGNDRSPLPYQQPGPNYREPSPPNRQQSEVAYRSVSPPVQQNQGFQYRSVPPPARQQFGNGFRAMSPPVRQATPEYRAFSPSIERQNARGFESLSPPDQNEANDRPPSILMVGRKPAPNTWREV